MGQLLDFQIARASKLNRARRISKTTSSLTDFVFWPIAVSTSFTAAWWKSALIMGLALSSGRPLTETRSAVAKLHAKSLQPRSHRPC
jgi:hypothetical protein